MIIKRRQQLTLIEVLISLALTMLLLSTLTYFYQDIMKMNVEYEKLRKEGFQFTYVENRLSNILPKAVSPTDKKKDFAFFTSGDANGFLKMGQPSLIFAFDSGVEVDKNFANHVVGRLFVNKDNQLILATWPSPKRWESIKQPPMKKEILMDQVDSLHFEFYVPPGKANNQHPIEPKNAWHKEWKQEYQKLPAMVRVLLTRQGKSMNFVFPIPASDLVIHYDQ